MNMAGKFKSLKFFSNVAAIGFTLFLIGCSEELQFGTRPNQIENPPSVTPPHIDEVPDAEPDGPTICDPNELPPASNQHGVKGKMALLPEGANLSFVNLASFWSPDPMNANELLPAVSVPAVFYFSEINVPERAFSEGFSYHDGGALRDPRDLTGETILIEWFSLKLEGHLKLRNATAGNYYLSVIADDGAKLEIWSNGNWVEIINNDGTHPQKMGCSMPGTYLTLNTNSDVRYRITYFQGPRYHISLMLLWKHLAPGEEVLAADPLCGQGGNDFFHNSRVVPSVPTANWDALVSRGWNTVPAENFHLPTGSVNPCAEVEE